MITRCVDVYIILTAMKINISVLIYNLHLHRKQMFSLEIKLSNEIIPSRNNLTENIDIK